MPSKKHIIQKLNQLEQDLKRLKEDIDSHYSQESSVWAKDDISPTPDNIDLERLRMNDIDKLTKEERESLTNNFVTMPKEPSDIIDLNKWLEITENEWIFSKTYPTLHLETGFMKDEYFKLKPTLINKKFGDITVSEYENGNIHISILKYDDYAFWHDSIVIPKEVADKILNKEGLK